MYWHECVSKYLCILSCTIYFNYYFIFFLISTLNVVLQNTQVCSLYVKTYLAIDPILILTLQDKGLAIFPKMSNCSFKSFIKQTFKISTFPLAKCDDLLFFSVLYHLNCIPLGFRLLFLPNNPSENVTLGSGKLWLEVLTIFWHFNDQTIHQTGPVCPFSPEQGFS